MVKNAVNILAPSNLIGFSSFLQVTRTTITSRLTSKFGKTGPRNAELHTIGRLEKSTETYNGRNIVSTQPPSFQLDLLHSCR